jgi:site-specific DNA-methyltransferase (adenine-specific)
MKPYYQDEWCTIYHGDFRDGDFTAALIVADPPYGQTSLKWDRWVTEWPCRLLGVAPQLWCFGSMRMFMDHASEFEKWNFSQDLVWEKHNGSSFHADRFRRVHEQVCHFYQGQWSSLTINTVRVMGGRKKVIRRKKRPTHMGDINGMTYRSEDGGPRIMRSVIKMPSCHGKALHPTQKPVGLIIPLIEYGTDAGMTVFDPFMGSGSTLEAARQIGRKSVGIDVSEACCEMAAKRLGQSVFQL